MPPSARLACSKARTRREGPGRPSSPTGWHHRRARLDPCRTGLSLSVQSLDPIVGYGAGWTRSRLVLGVVTGRGEFRPGGVLVGLEVPEPLLARLKALNVAMAAVPEVGARVLARRGVATSDVTALRAPSQVEPPAGWV